MVIMSADRKDSLRRRMAKAWSRFSLATNKADMVTHLKEWQSLRRALEGRHYAQEAKADTK